MFTLIQANSTIHETDRVYIRLVKNFEGFERRYNHYISQNENAQRKDPWRQKKKKTNKTSCAWSQEKHRPYLAKGSFTKQQLHI